MSWISHFKSSETLENSIPLSSEEDVITSRNSFSARSSFSEITSEDPLDSSYLSDFSNLPLNSPINWKQVVCSYTGKYIAAIDNSFDFHVWVNFNFGLSEWVKFEIQPFGGQTISDMSLSADGNKLVICDYNGYVWVGQKEKKTYIWKHYTQEDVWSHIKISGDGNTIVAIADYIHIGFGNNQKWQWEISLLFGSHLWKSVAISHTGEIIMISIENSNKIYISSDRGKKFIAHSFGKVYNLANIVISLDGESFFAIDENYGVIVKGELKNDKWKISQFNCSIKNWKNISASGNLSTIFFSTKDGNLYKSCDYGATIKKEIDGKNTISSLSCSKDGNLAIISIFNQDIKIKNLNQLIKKYHQLDITNFKNLKVGDNLSIYSNTSDLTINYEEIISLKFNTFDEDTVKLINVIRKDSIFKNIPNKNIYLDIEIGILLKNKFPEIYLEKVNINEFNDLFEESDRCYYDVITEKDEQCFQIQTNPMFQETANIYFMLI